MAAPTPEQRRGGGLSPGLRISVPLGRQAAKPAPKSPKKPSEGDLTELVKIKIASFGGKKVEVFGQELARLPTCPISCTSFRPSSVRHPVSSRFASPAEQRAVPEFEEGECQAVRHAGDSDTAFFPGGRILRDTRDHAGIFSRSRRSFESRQPTARDFRNLASDRKLSPNRLTTPPCNLAFPLAAP